MNVLSLCGALLTASASVSVGSMQEVRHQNKMVEVVNKYQTNEVNSWDDLVIGNVYDFNFADWTLNDMLDGDGGFTLGLVDTQYLMYKIDLSEVYFNNLAYFYAPSTQIYYWLSDSDSFIDFNYVYANEDDTPYVEFEGYINGVFPFVYLGKDSFVNFLPYDSTMVTISEYVDLVPSNTHRGNLYTTIYDFFYGIFDTSDTNELSMTILGQEMSLTSWLAHSVTIILLLLGVLWLIWVIKWIFRVFSGLIKV